MPARLSVWQRISGFFAVSNFFGAAWLKKTFALAPLFSFPKSALFFFDLSCVCALARARARFRKGACFDCCAPLTALLVGQALSIILPFRLFPPLPPFPDPPFYFFVPPFFASSAACLSPSAAPPPPSGSLKTATHIPPPLLPRIRRCSPVRGSDGRGASGGGRNKDAEQRRRRKR